MSKANESRETTNYDSQWKMGITRLFRPFFELFFPSIAIQIDWARGWEALDKELMPEKSDDDVKVREADLVFKLYQLSGDESWVAIHVEVQAHRQGAGILEERVWLYSTRIRQRYGKKVCSLVVLGDLSREWKPDRFEEELWGCKRSLVFPVVKLLELEKELKSNRELADNPFSWMVNLHLAAKRSTPGGERRRDFKRAYVIEFFRAVRDGRLDPDDRETLQTIHAQIDGLLSLSVENDKLFREELGQNEEIQKMKQETPVVGMFERWAFEEGREEGRAEERQRFEATMKQREQVEMGLREQVELLSRRVRELEGGLDGADSGSAP